MKRQARPFVVEVKKRRGGLSAKRPIWAGLDLTAVANQEAPFAHDADTREGISVRHENEQEAAVAGRTRAQLDLVAAEIDDQAAGKVHSEDSEDLGRVSVAAEADMPERIRRQSQRHREAVASLPRGQRWKRRLPSALLCRTKRGA